MQMVDIKAHTFSFLPPSSFSGSYIEIKLEITQLIINLLQKDKLHLFVQLHRNFLS